MAMPQHFEPPESQCRRWRHVSRPASLRPGRHGESVFSHGGGGYLGIDAAELAERREIEARHAEAAGEAPPRAPRTLAEIRASLDVEAIRKEIESSVNSNELPWDQRPEVTATQGKGLKERMR